jgi:hypothetical protein
MVCHVIYAVLDLARSQCGNTAPQISSALQEVTNGS